MSKMSLSSKVLKNPLLGIVPSEWNIYSVGSLGEVVTGQTPSTSRQGYFGGDIPFVSPADIDGQRYISQAQVTLTDKGAKRAHILPINTILVTCIGGLGKVGQAKTSFCLVLNNLPILHLLILHNSKPFPFLALQKKSKSVY
jgi:type I restriction enzyme S subunit